MKKTYKNVLLSLCAISLLAGCASKDVEYDGSSSADNSGKSVDSKVEQISGSSEQSVDGSSIVEETIAGTASYLTQDRNSVKSEINGQTVTLDSIHFAFDKYSLSTDMRDVATTNATTITNVTDSYDSLKIKLEGNCDEWGTDEYNYALGIKRAKVTKDALVADGVDANRIMLVSFGESNPVCTDKNVDCWKMNRRVDYRLLP